MSTHVSMLAIDALAGGHLPPAEADAARAHIAGCARCREDLAAAEAAVATFTREVFSRTVDRLAPTPWWRRLGVAPLLVPVLAAAALLFWLKRPAPSGEHVDDTFDLRIKGAVTFKVFAKRGETVTAVVDGARLAPGDAIRFVASARTDRFLIVGSIDGRNNATIYFPYGAAQSGPVSATPAELPGSIVLDDAPGPERIFALFSTQPLEAAAVTQALLAVGARGADAIRSTTTLEIGAAHTATLLFEKGPR